MTVSLVETPETEADEPEQPRLVLEPSRQFAEWLAGLSTSLCLTSCQAGKIFMIGSAENGGISVFERTLNRCMGLAVTPRSIYVSTQWLLWRFENALPAGQTKDGYDAVYVPQSATVTGEIDIHDMAVDKKRQLVFVNTLFSCLATTSDSYSFRPLWQPPFVTELEPEDRCHLNGLAMRNGLPAYATTASQTNTAESWREHRRDGGCVIDVKSNEIIAHSLSMPHSPRWYDGKLWLHNSGAGEFGYIDLDSGRFEPVCFCPGYLRGLAFCDGYAVMGLSKPRGDKGFDDLALGKKLKKIGSDAQCGLIVVDLNSGKAVHSLKFDGELLSKVVYGFVMRRRDPGVLHSRI